MKQKSNAGHLAQRAVMTLVTAVIVAASSVVSVQAANKAIGTSIDSSIVDDNSKETTSVSFKGDEVTVTTKNSSGEKTSIIIFKLAKLMEILGVEGNDGDKIQAQIAKKLATPPQNVDLSTAVKDPKVLYQPKSERVVFTPEDYKVVNFYEHNKYRGTYYKFVIRHKSYTQVDYVINVAWDWHWLIPNGNSYLLDKSSGDKYMQHSTLVSMPINRAIYFHGLKGKTVVVTSIYPPLDKDVKEVDLIELEIEDLLYPSDNRASMDYMNKNLKVYDSVDDLPYGLAVEGKVITLDADFELPKNDSKLYR